LAQAANGGAYLFSLGEAGEIGGRFVAEPLDG
jgi:hypothetical protein